MNVVALAELVGTHQLLASLSLDDPLLAVANAAVWLCPDLAIDRDPDELDLDPSGDPDATLNAMLICMDEQPSIYAEARAEWLCGGDVRTVSNILVDRINEKLHLPLEWIYDFIYGPPVLSTGADLRSEEWWEGHWWLEPVLGRLGVRINQSRKVQARGMLDVEFSDAAFERVCKAMAQSLQTGEMLLFDLLPGEVPSMIPPYEAVMWLLRWLSNSTGNDAADIPADQFWEYGFDYPDWSEASIETINAMNEEQDQIWAAAKAGATLLLNDKEWMNALDKNYRRLKRMRTDDTQQLQRACRWPGRAKHASDSPAARDA
jgi:hypothetical protein